MLYYSGEEKGLHCRLAYRQDSGKVYRKEARWLCKYCREWLITAVALDNKITNHEYWLACRDE